ncbi:hypothetical protein PsYK624_118270 [Phanerochaete sordida]|uniref:Uncharacterized protein n=1 Tax=Phanerochaete sordida TaxID=48140 RepID=A0A9P3GIY8_9APHY|nr:hypothetical protein PsYK624_118270 [Phanerochaete sordida]
MAASYPVLPPEIVHAIVSRAIARHFDDVLVGPLSLGTAPEEERDRNNKMAAPVTALLAVSCQVRQSALIVLSDALRIPLSRVGIWKLADKPWKKIDRVRQLLRHTFDFHADKRSFTGFLVVMTHPEPPVLVVYVYTHVLDELSARLPDSLFIPGPEGQTPITLDSCGIALLVDRHIQENYAKCPSAFQEMLYTRMDRSLARNAIAQFHTGVILPISEAWTATANLARRIASETVGAEPAATCARVAQELATILREMHVRERAVRRNWPHTVPIDVAIGADRLAEWCGLFDDMARWEYECESAQELKEVAKDFADYFHARLLALGASEGTDAGAAGGLAESEEAERSTFPSN